MWSPETAAVCSRQSMHQTGTRRRRFDLPVADRSTVCPDLLIQIHTNLTMNCLFVPDTGVDCCLVVVWTSGLMSAVSACPGVGQSGAHSLSRISEVWNKDRPKQRISGEEDPSLTQIARRGRDEDGRPLESMSMFHLKSYLIIGLPLFPHSPLFPEKASVHTPTFFFVPAPTYRLHH